MALVFLFAGTVAMKSAQCHGTMFTFCLYYFCLSILLFYAVLADNVP